MEWGDILFRRHVDSGFARRWVYFNKSDENLLVPKRMGWGWTVNLGHPWAPWVLLGLVIVPVAAASAYEHGGEVVQRARRLMRGEARSE